MYIEAMNRLLRDKELKKKVVAFIEVPGWVGSPVRILVDRLNSGKNLTLP